MTHTFLTLCLVVFMSLHLQAKEYKGIQFPDEITIEKTKLKLNGTAVRKYLAIIDVYAAGVYIAEPSQDAEVILKTSTPKRIVMHFKRQVDKTKLQEAWKKGFFENAPTAYTYRPDLNRLDSLMTFFKVGDVMEITFFPEKTEFKIKNEPLQTFIGKDFSYTMLKIFLTHEDLKEGLLGKLKK